MGRHDPPDSYAGCVCVKVREGRLSLGQGTLHGGLMDLILFTCL